MNEITPINQEDLCLSLMYKANFLSTRKELIRYFGSSDPPSFLTFLIGQRTYFKSEGGLTPDGFFYATMEDVEKEIGFSRRVQESCIQKLKEENLIRMEVRTKETRRYFQILFENVNLIILNGRKCRKTTFVEKPTTCEKSSNGHECTERAFANVRNVRTIIKTNNKKQNKCCFIVPKGTMTTRVPLVVNKTILPRKANNPLILVDSSEPVIEAKPEGAKPIFTKTVYKKQPLKCPPISFNTQQIIDYWNKKGLLRHREDSGAFAQSVMYIDQAFEGTLFDKFIEQPWHHKSFTVDEIKRCIDNFYIAAHDKDYEPISIRTKQWLQSLRLCSFLYNPREDNDERKSQLLIYTAKPKLISQSKIFSLKDTHPRCTKLVKDWYHQEFGGMVTEVSRHQQNSMILVGRKIEEFLVTHKSKLDMDYGMQVHCNRDPMTFLVGQLLRCESKILRENAGSRSVFQPSWLISENMLSDRFIYFLKSEHMMK